MKYISVLALFFSVSLLTLPISVFAAEDEVEFEAVPEPPQLPDPLESGEAIEPEVTIIQKDEGTIQEYRMNGFLYKVKVTPNVGPVYYLVDRNGDGQLEKVNDVQALDNDFVVPQWVLFEW